MGSDPTIRTPTASVEGQEVQPQQIEREKLNMRSTKSNQFLVVAFAISMLTTLCCVQDTPATPELSTSTLYDFEREYSKTLAYESDQSYKLIGYKKIKLNKDEMTEYLRIYQGPSR
jgi:hypothetical protein